jgi:hypothetical protein
MSNKIFVMVQLDLAGAWDDLAYDCFDDSHPGHPSNFGDR